MGFCSYPPAIITGVWAGAGVIEGADGASLERLLSDQPPNRTERPTPPQPPSAPLLPYTLLPLTHVHKEYCSRGSLTDVLLRAREDPETAVVLTWSLRLHMVRPV